MKAPGQRILIVQDLLQRPVKFRVKANFTSTDHFIRTAPLLKCQDIATGPLRNLRFGFFRGQSRHIQTIDGGIREIDPFVFLAHSHIDSTGSNCRSQDCSPDCYGNFSAGSFAFLSLVFRIRCALILRILIQPALMILFHIHLPSLPVPFATAAPMASPLIFCFHKYLSFLLYIVLVSYSR